jgi:hypothetical protein
VSVTIFRVQHRIDGRGPYRPGISRLWAAPSGPDWPDILTEFGIAWRDEIPLGWHAGCAFLSMADMLTWFLPSERSKLTRMGYRPVEMEADTIIRRGALQVIAARRLPFSRECKPLTWTQARKLAA